MLTVITKSVNLCEINYLLTCDWASTQEFARGDGVSYVSNLKGP